MLFNLETSVIVSQNGRTMLKVWQARGKGGKEARKENNRFKPICKSLKQATLLLVWEKKLKGRESTVYN